MTGIINSAPVRKTVAIGNYLVELRIHDSGVVGADVTYKGQFLHALAADDYDTALLLAGGEIRYHTGLRVNGQASRLVFSTDLQEGDQLTWGIVRSIEVLDDEVLITTTDGHQTGVSATEQLRVKVD